MKKEQAKKDTSDRHLGEKRNRVKKYKMKNKQGKKTQVFDT